MKVIEVTKNKRYVVKKIWNNELWKYTVEPQVKLFGFWWISGQFENGGSMFIFVPHYYTEWEAVKEAKKRRSQYLKV